MLDMTIDSACLKINFHFGSTFRYLKWLSMHMALFRNMPCASIRLHRRLMVTQLKACQHLHRLVCNIDHAQMILYLLQVQFERSYNMKQ